MCIYVCVYIYIYIYVCVYICTYTCMYIYIYEYMHLYMYMCLVNAAVCPCNRYGMSAHLGGCRNQDRATWALLCVVPSLVSPFHVVHIQIHAYICIHIYIYTYIYTYIHIYVHIQRGRERETERAVYVVMMTSLRRPARTWCCCSTAWIMGTGAWGFLSMYIRTIQFSGR